MVAYYARHESAAIQSLWMVVADDIMGKILECWKFIISPVPPQHRSFSTTTTKTTVLLFTAQVRMYVHFSSTVVLLLRLVVLLGRNTKTQKQHVLLLLKHHHNQIKNYGHNYDHYFKFRMTLLSPCNTPFLSVYCIRIHHES